MVRITWKVTRLLTHFLKNVRFKYYILKVSILSLFYNHHLSWIYVGDTILEPMFWFVDNFTKILGPIFVFMVILLNASAVFIAYYIGVPYYWAKSQSFTIVLISVGQFFLVNVIFHYWMAVTRGPGFPPAEGHLPHVVSICKKCISPKPPRTHHCSVCDRCVLKMDHHCPWLNNCVGHQNHRHFFLYMCYTAAGCLFLMIFGFEILWVTVFPPDEDPTVSNSTSIAQRFYKKNVFSREGMIMYEALLSSGAFLSLTGLCIWHGRLITRGETSIEGHINKSEVKRLKAKGKTYKNPYDFGPWHNWYLFLGMTDGRGWRHVLFPSTHKPKGQGLEWDSIYGCDIRWTYDH